MYSLDEFRDDFPDHEACLVYLWQTLYAAADGEHAECPHCETVQRFKRYDTTQKRHSWTCTACGHHIQPTAGTIFQKSSTPLDRWFTAIYLIAATDGEVSAKELQRELDVTYKTAWRINRLIRERLAVAPVAVPVVVPADDPPEARKESLPVGDGDLEPADRGLLGRRVRRQIARVTHDQRVARHHTSVIYSQGIAAIRHKIPGTTDKPS
jgi:transposase-like protein